MFKHQFIVRIRLKVHQMRWGTVETVGLRHRKSSLVIKTPPNEKALAPPGGSKDRKHFSAVPPCLPPARPLMTMPTHRLPHNAGNASKILRPTARSLRPLRPICCPAARSALSTRNSLWRRQAALLPLRRFQNMLCLFNTKCVRLSSTFFHRRRTSWCLSLRSKLTVDSYGIPLRG